MAAFDPAGHHEFEELAVQHVLGGLPREASSRFRDHLTSCSSCRLRVVELRDIAADLESAAREERVAANTKLETARREPPTVPASEPPRVSPEAVRNVIAVLALLFVVLLSFWNVHLGAVREALQGSLEVRGAVLDTLVEGELLDPDIRVRGMRALVAVDAGRVAIDASGVPQILEDRRVVLWSVDQAGTHRLLAQVGPAGAPDGRVVLHVEGVAGERLILSLESFPVGNTPQGTIVMEADLSPERSTSD